MRSLSMLSERWLDVQIKLDVEPLRPIVEGLGEFTKVPRFGNLVLSKNRVDLFHGNCLAARSVAARWAIKLGGVLVSERVGRGNKNGRLKTLQVADEFLYDRSPVRYRARVARAGLVGLCDTEGHTLLRMALTLSFEGSVSGLSV